MPDNLSISLTIGGRVDRTLLRAITSTKASLAGLTQTLRGLRESDRQAKNLRKMEAALDATRVKVSSASAKYQELGRALSSTNAPSAQLVRNFRLAEQENERLQRSFAKQSVAVSKLSSELREAGVDTANLGRSQTRLATQINAAATAQARLLALQTRAAQNRQQIAGIYGQLLEAGALGFGLSRAIRPAVEFESAMADVAKVTNLSSEELDVFSGKIQQLSRDIPLTQKELAEIAAAGGRLGIDQIELPDFVGIISRLSTAFNILPEAAGESFAQLRDIFELPLSGVAELGDAINFLGNNLAAKEADIVDVIRRVGGVSKQFGLSAEQTAAFGASLLALGKSPEVAATGINALLVKLQAAEAQGSKFQDALDDLGLSSRELAADIAADPQQALLDFLFTLRELDTQARTVTLVNLFGQEYADDISLLVGSLGKYQQALGLVADRQAFLGSAELEAQKRIETTAAQLTLLGNGAREAAINFGTALLPALKSIVASLREFTGLLADFASANPEIAAAIGIAVTGLVALRIAMIAAKGVTLLFSGAFLQLAGVFARFRAAAAIGAISNIGAAAAGASGGVGALRLAFISLRSLTIVGAITAASAALVKFGGDLLEARNMLRESEQAAKDYEKNLENIIESIKGFAEVQQQPVEGLNQAEFANYSEALAKHEEYWRARLLLEQEQTGQAEELTRQRWEASLEELRVLNTAEAQREGLVNQALLLNQLAQKAEVSQTENLREQISQREGLLEKEKTKLGEIIEARKKFQQQVAEARQEINKPQPNELTQGTVIEVTRQLDQARSLLNAEDFSGATDAATKTIELLKQLVAAGAITDQFANSLLGQAADVGETALLSKQRDQESQTAIADEQVNALKQQLIVAQEELDADPLKVKVTVEEGSIQTITDLIQQHFAENPVVLPVTTPNADTSVGAPGFARGGLLSGAGTGKSDSLLLRGSAGEFITRAKAVQHYGVDFFRKLNALQLPKFATGGLIGNIQVPQMAAPQTGSQFTVNFGSDSFDLTENNGRGDGFVSALKNQITRRGRRR